MESLQFLNPNKEIKSLKEEDIREFRSVLNGNVLLPDDIEYQHSRKVWNGMIDRKPAMIVKCSNREDIQEALKFAGKHQITVTVRGGGHHVSGSAVRDKSMMIDLSEMKDIKVDVENKTVKSQPGVTWGELDKQTQEYGYSVPGGAVSTTGVAGLTLGGGIGWLRRKYGLSCDNLLSAEVVTAKGELLEVNEKSHPDLFWALKGGGGGFGIVSSFQFQLHEVGPEVMFCLVFYPASETEKFLKFYREKAPSLPDEVSSFLIYGTVPFGEPFPEEQYGRDYILFAGMYSGSVKEGEKVLQPFREVSRPLLDLSEPMNYTEVQTFFDEDYPKHELNYYWKSLLFNNLTDEAIDNYIALGKTRPSSLSTVDIWHLGGAIDKVKHADTAYPHRNANYLLGVEANWEKNKEDHRNIVWTKQAIEKFKSLSDGYSYLNFEGEGAEDVKAAQGKHHQKLQETKKKYDPDNLII